MSRRVITPFDEGPEKWYLESLVKEEPTLTPLGGSLDPKKQKSKRKRQRTKSSNEEYEGKGHASHGPRRGSERQLSISSDISAKSEEDLADVIEILSMEENLEETRKNIKVGTVNVLKFRTHFFFCSHLKCWLSGLELTKCLSE